MKKDIPDLKVEDIALAIVPRNEDDEELWDSYLINFKDTTIESVLINSKGYGEVDGEEVKTTVLRHFFEEVGPMRCILIEPIQTKLFDLTNEYWISFVQNDYMYDKKYVFVRGSISEENFTTIPFINRKGVMIK
jgi:hypothetical protein